MMTAVPSGWGVRGATFALWLLAAGSLVHWGLKLSAAPSPVLPTSGAARAATVDGEAVARVLGATAALPQAVAAAPALASRFQLIGVAAGADSGGGAAVIAVDGRPGKPFRVGSAVDEGLVLQSVHGRQAVLAPSMQAPATLTLELPVLAAARSAASAPGMMPPPATAPVIAPRPAIAPSPAPAADGRGGIVRRRPGSPP